MNIHTAGTATANENAVVNNASAIPPATAFSLAVAVPAVWMFNYFTGKVDGFIIEMDNSASELLDYFLKSRTRRLNP